MSLSQVFEKTCIPFQVVSITVLNIILRFFQNYIFSATL